MSTPNHNTLSHWMLQKHSCVALSDRVQTQDSLRQPAGWS